MIHNLFSLPIYLINLKDNIDLSSIESHLLSEFNKFNNVESPLEKQNAKSTYGYNSSLHLEPFSKKISEQVINHANLYWKILDIDSRLSPEIDECWANIHGNEGFTVLHSHSLMPMVATLYVRADKNSGGIVFTNPMEYGITHIPYSVPIEQKIETTISVKSGDLLLFPGWIRHRTEENCSDTNRIVMSFNIKYSGKYLKSNTDYPDTSLHKHVSSEVEHLQNKILTQEFIIEDLKRNLTNERKT